MRNTTTSKRIDYISGAYFAYALFPASRRKEKPAAPSLEQIREAVANLSLPFDTVLRPSRIRTRIESPDSGDLDITVKTNVSTNVRPVGDGYYEVTSSTTITYRRTDSPA